MKIVNKKKIIITVAIVLVLVLSVVGFYVYADKATEYNSTKPEIDPQYGWGRLYGFRAKIRFVEYGEELHAAKVYVEIVKNYNEYLGDYPVDAVFMKAPYAEYFLSGGEYDEYLIFTTKFVGDDGIYPLQIAIGIDGEDIFVINEGNIALEAIYGKGEFYKKLSDFENDYYPAVENRKALDEWYDEYEKEIELEYTLLEIKYKLTFVWMILGGVALVCLFGMVFLKINNRKRKDKKDK